MSDPSPGEVEAAFRRWVTTLGTLSPLQQADAERLYRLAAEMDLRTDRPAAAYGTLNRAISSIVDRLRDEKARPVAGPTPTGDTPSNVVPPDVVEQARAAREERRSGGTP